MKWPAYNFQLKAVKFLLERGGAGLWLDPGLGKTSIALAAFDMLRTAKTARRALVIAPLHVARLTWPDELRKWDDFKHLSFNILHGFKKDVALRGMEHIHIINPEGLSWLAESLDSAKPYDVLIVDESTKFKNWSAQRTKILRKMLNSFKRRWTLTGTPAPNSLQDLFPQAFIMDGGRALGPHITSFRYKYMMQGGYLGYEWFPRAGAWQEVAKKLAPLVMRLSAKDHLDMPELVENPISVELPPEARKQYNKLEKDFFIELDKGDVTAVNAAALSMKLRQAANGTVYLENGEAVPLHLAKLEALETLTEELQDEPLLVAVSFLSEVAAIRKSMGADIPYLGGGVSAKAATDIMTKWNAGKLPILLVHPASISHGLNMQKSAHHICWFGLTWNFEEYTQLIRRIWRQGQRHRVIVHQLIARNTLDAVVLEALRGKDHTQAALMAQVVAYGKKR